MIIENAIHSRLSNHSGLSALVAARIYPVVVPQSAAYPCVSYQLITAPRASAMSADTGDVAARYQLNAWAEGYASARAVAVQIRAALQRFSGTVEGVVIKGIFIQHELDDYNEATKRWRIIQDYIINHEE